MEPRPQKPRPQPQQGNTPPASGPPQQPQVGPDPAQQTQQHQPYGYDPSAFSAPPRAEYDYSPLDLQPPGQRRKRQVIAGIIGALVVVAIGALLVAGWMALRDDDDTVDPTPTNDRVAELSSTPAENTETTTGESTPAAGVETTAETPAPTAPPAATEAPATTTYTTESIRGTLPVVESMPGDFSEGGDTPQDLPTVVEALGGGPEVETMLTGNGWQAAMTRTFVSNDPATTGTSTINVSSHAFKDQPSALAALPEYATILEGYGWTKVEGEQVGDGSVTLNWTNTETGEDAVTIYFVDGQLLYRVFAIGPTGFDSTPNALHVVRQIVGG